MLSKKPPRTSNLLESDSPKSSSPSKKARSPASHASDSPVQAAFVQEGGTQCGFCAPGMILSATALLEKTTDPSEEEILDALAGNLCRCTGYVQIIESVKRAAASLRDAAAEGDGA